MLSPFLESVIDYFREHPGERPANLNRQITTGVNYLTLLVKTGILRKERRGRETRYYVNKSQ